jgi:hypothetical protein
VHDIGGALVLTTPKAEKARTIIVPGVVAEELCRHVRDHQAEGMLFNGRRRDQVSLQAGGDGEPACRRGSETADL